MNWKITIFLKLIKKIKKFYEIFKLKNLEKKRVHLSKKIWMDIKFIK